MQEGVQTFAELSNRKSFELAYAIFRITRVIQSRSFGEKLEERALALLEDSVLTKYENVRAHLEMLEYFLRIGVEAGYIYQDHAETIFGEMTQFYQALAEHADREAPPPISLEGVFSKIDFHPGKPKPDLEAMRVEPKPLPNEVPPEGSLQRPKAANGNGGSGNEKQRQGPGGEERKAKILALVQRFGRIRMKDIQNELPEVSERTLRYDLQNLVAEGQMLRMGEVGPMVTYISAKGRSGNQGGGPTVGSAKIEQAFSGYFES